MCDETRSTTVSLLNRFIARRDVFAEQFSDGRYEPVRRKLIDTDIALHIDGKRTFGTYTLIPDGDGPPLVRHGCIDIDTMAVEIVRAIYSAAIALVPKKSVVAEFSGRRGFHVWILLCDPIPARTMRRLLDAIVEIAGLTNQVEVFPKQTAMPVGGFGNLVKIPLGLHLESGKRSYFVDPSSLNIATPAPLNPEELNVSPLSLEDVETALSTVDAEVDVRTASPPIRPASAGAASEERIPEGKRNVTLTSLAGFLRWRGLSQSEVDAALQEINRNRCTTPLAKAEVEKIARSVARYEPALSLVSFDSTAQGGALLPAAESERAEPFPIEVFPERIQRVATTAAHAITCPIDFLGVFVLVFSGVAIGITRVIEIKQAWCEGPRLYAAVVSDPGAKKSPALEVASRPLNVRQSRLLREHEEAMLRFQEELAQFEIDEADWRKQVKSGGAQPGDKPAQPVEPALRQVFTTDSTLEALAELLEMNRRGVLFLRDELTAWALSFNQYKGGKGADRQGWLSFWSGATTIVNRKSRRAPIILQNPFVSVAGCLPPDVLDDLSDERGREDGFIHRILFAYPERMKGKWVEEGIPPQILADLNDVFDFLWSLEPEKGDETEERPVKVGFSSEGKRVWVEWITQHYEEQELPTFPENLRGPWAKFEGYTARLSLIIHFLRLACGETSSDDVDEVSVAAAWALIDYFKSHARRVYRRLRTTPDDQRALGALAWIRKQPEKDGMIRVSARDILTNHVAGVKASSEAKALLKDLEDRGFGMTAEASKSQFLFILHKPTQQAAGDGQDEGQT